MSYTTKEQGNRSTEENKSRLPTEGINKKIATQSKKERNAKEPRGPRVKLLLTHISSQKL